MNRRALITLLGGAAVAWPHATRAQPPMAGFLHSSFQQAMAILEDL